MATFEFRRVCFHDEHRDSTKHKNSPFSSLRQRLLFHWEFFSILFLFYIKIFSNNPRFVIVVFYLTFLYKNP